MFLDGMEDNEQSLQESDLSIDSPSQGFLSSGRLPKATALLVQLPSRGVNRASEISLPRAQRSRYLNRTLTFTGAGNVRFALVPTRRDRVWP
jgi:hypothetical protein